jgi:hypothetical protein
MIMAQVKARLKSEGCAEIPLPMARLSLVA